MKKTKGKFIGHITTIPMFVKKEYLSKKKKHANFVFIEINSDKKYGAIARLYERNSIFDRIKETTTKKERESISKRMSLINENDKPVDTSNWVKPDEESIRNALIECLFALEILKEDSINYREYYGKAQAFYSILHCHAPKNPQQLNDWVIDPYFMKIMDELKCPVSKNYWKEFNAMFKSKKTKKDLNKHRKDYQKWKKECLKKMIIKDPSPHKFVNIFKRHSKKNLEKKRK